MALPARAIAADAVQEANLEQMIEKAKTPADHEAIARHYDQRAAEANGQVQWHQKLLKAYMAAPRLSTMQMHCSRLVDLYRSEAKEDRKLAQEHREMGKAAKSESASQP
jgi:hypothetical protein